MIFYVFYSNFSLHGSLENAVFEHLEWLKFQKNFPGALPQNPCKGTYSNPQTPKLYCALPMAV